MDRRTTMEILSREVWDGVAEDVALRIRLLKCACAKLNEAATQEQRWVLDQVATDLILPCVALLGQFCVAVKPDDDLFADVRDAMSANEHDRLSRALAGAYPDYPDSKHREAARRIMADIVATRRVAHSDLAHDEMKDDRVLHERFDLHGFPRTREED